jgi:hypothetical protein
MEETKRDAKLIADQMKLVRTGSASIESWPLSDITDDINTISAEILTQTPKVINGNKAAAARVRKYLLTLETLGKEFRKKSM